MCAHSHAHVRVYVCVYIHVRVRIYTCGRAYVGRWAWECVRGRMRGYIFPVPPVFCTVLTETPVNTGFYAVQKAVQNCNGLYRYKKHQFREIRITQHLKGFWRFLGVLQLVTERYKTVPFSVPLL